jgi:uncharacterized protein (TIRG00374 family)
MKRVLVPLLKVGLSGGLLYLLLSRIDVRQLWDVASRASGWWLGAACGLYVFQLLLGAWKWGLLLRAQGIEMNTRTLFSSCLVALFFNNFFPGTIGGDVMRIGDTAAQAGSKTLATTVIMMDRVLGLLGLVLAGAVAVSLAPADSGQLPVSIRWLWACLLAGAMLLVAVLLWPDVLKRLAGVTGMTRREWIVIRLGRLVDALVRFRRRPSALVGGLAAAISVHAVLIVFYIAIVRSMSIPVPAGHVAVLIPMSFIVQAVPISFNGLGVREATFSIYFARLGVPLESALAVSFTSVLIAVLMSLAGAIVYVLRRPASPVPGQH